jgi:NAD(P)-dependent dehydrogenase (short-subunit alcohol dehydrogenase family)
MTSCRKVALVTGAGSGIGRASALALQGEGFHVVLVGRRLEALEETARLGMSDGPSLLPIPADVSDPEAVRAVFAKTKETFGRLDFLFNNAGIGAPRIPIEDLKYGDWKRTVDVNLTGSFLCAQEAIKIMKDQTPRGGRIVNNGSVSAHSPRPNTVAYTSTKHAITGLAKSISLDGRKYDIACGQLDVGNADTPLGGRMKHGVPQADGSIRPEPVISVENCARAIAFMASLPLDANVQSMMIMATKMPFIGRG